MDPMYLEPLIKKKSYFFAIFKNVKLNSKFVKMSKQHFLRNTEYLGIVYTQNPSKITKVIFD